MIIANAILLGNRRSSFSPESLANKVLWLRADETTNSSGEVDVWIDKFGIDDADKVSDARRPNVLSAIDNGNQVVRFTRANNDILQQSAALDITDDFTIYIRFSCVDPTIVNAQFLIENIDNGLSYDATRGIQVAVVNSLIRIDFRYASGTQRLEFAFTDTGKNIIEIKHLVNGTSSVRTVKLNGEIKQIVNNLNACVPAVNTLKIGSNFQNFSLDGDISEIIITSDYHDIDTENRVINYLKNRYAETFDNTPDLAVDFDFSGWTELDAISNKRFNGLYPILRGDNKYDFFTGTVEGDVYYGQQGATINDWTWTQVRTGQGEIQSLKAFYYNSKWHIITAHKVTGEIRLHIPQDDLDGTYDTYTLLTDVVEIQDIKMNVFDNSGLPQFSYSYQGDADGKGGVYWLKFTGSDITDPLDWTNYEIVQHNAAWWHTEIFEFGGDDYIAFSARSNNANPSEVPGVYLVQLNADPTLSGTESTLDATDRDWLHVRLGNFFGNGVDTDIAAISINGLGKIFLFDSSNAWAMTTIDLNPSKNIENIINVGDPFGTGRDSLVGAYLNDFGRFVYWNGVTWSMMFGQMAATNNHPYDNEGYLLDVDNSGTVRLVVDDNEEAPVYGHIKCCTFGKPLTQRDYL